MRFFWFLRKLKKIVGAEAVLDRAEDRSVYEYDGGFSRGLPCAVAFPKTTDEVARIVRLCREANVSIVPSGAGTGLSGGAISRAGSLVLGFSRMNRILEIDAVTEREVVQPAFIIYDLSNALAKHGL